MAWRLYVPTKVLGRRRPALGQPCLVSDQLLSAQKLRCVGFACNEPLAMTHLGNTTPWTQDFCLAQENKQTQPIYRVWWRVCCMWLFLVACESQLVGATQTCHSNGCCSRCLLFNVVFVFHVCMLMFRFENKVFPRIRQGPCRRSTQYRT